ncbi:DUF3772 domain-containing protein [Xanthobacter sp. TB0139]|uniref:DUF3772 domain-containing protein n=1 Tax=Xanthobacter sp. TB0139 TaxID=3459178 RepID=UPI004039D266
MAVWRTGGATVWCGLVPSEYKPAIPGRSGRCFAQAGALLAGLLLFMLAALPAATSRAEAQTVPSSGFVSQAEKITLSEAEPADKNGAAPGEASAAAPSAPFVPQDPLLTTARAEIETARASLASLESALAVEGLRAADLDELRGRIVPIRRELGKVTDELVPRLAEIRSRLATLPPAPTDGAAEDPLVVADRARLTALTSALEGVLTPIRALSEQAEGLSNRISTRRRALFTSLLFERSPSMFDPVLWTEAVASVSGEFRATHLLLNDWGAFIIQKEGRWGGLGILAGSLAVVLAVVVVGRLVRTRLRTPPPPAEGTTFSRGRAALEAIKVLFLEAAVAPLAVAGGVMFAELFDAIPTRMEGLIEGLIAAVTLKAFGTAMARAAIAPGEPWRRLTPISDHDAAVAFKYFSWAVWTMALAVVFFALHRTLFAPLSLMVVSSGVMALMIAGFLARFLVYLSRKDMGEETEGAAEGVVAAAGASPRTRSPEWIRFLVWLLVALMVVGLAAGYVSFAAFVAGRLVLAGIILGVLYVLYALIDAAFEDRSREEEHRRLRPVARLLGLSPMNLELIGVILAGLLKVVLLLVAVLLVVGSWGTSTIDVMEMLADFSFGIRIGNVTISAWNVLYAVALLLLGLGLAQMVQRWISRVVLPRTKLEASLQSSISTIVGYVGTIAALMVAMSELGLNLENVALVAGALSVGIGFGLQSIVSNFVSGIILLAERPIRVGDTINVKGEEGYVRRISVRSTEIETFDRSAVIVPNSDLITGMVKNFTHANTSGRIIITLNASYDADPELVRDLLVSCACDHPQVLQTPPPRVLLLKFSEMGLGFELRCVVANVDFSATVRSDLHFAILTRFREAGVGLAYWPWASMARAPADMVPPPVREAETPAVRLENIAEARGDAEKQSPARASSDADEEMNRLVKARTKPPHGSD